MNMEAWRKNENAGSFDQLTKGTLLTVEGYFKPEEWADQGGVKHNRIVMVAVKFYPAVEKEEAPAEPKRTRSKFCLIQSRAVSGPLLFCSLPFHRITTFIYSVHSPLTRRRPLIFPAKLRRA